MDPFFEFPKLIKSQANIKRSLVDNSILDHRQRVHQRSDHRYIAIFVHEFGAIVLNDL